MAQRSTVSRRRALRSLAGAVAVTAGCLSPRSRSPAGPAEPPTPIDSTDAAGPAEREPRSATATAPASGDELDLREANVVGVEVDQRGETVRFAVTLYHDDDGEDGYADWWQVGTVEGTALGRHELLHPHSSAPFTRSGSFAVPAGITCVVVRGHDRTHGYGGRAMLVDVSTGATRSIEQGSDPRPIGAGSCP